VFSQEAILGQILWQFLWPKFYLDHIEAKMENMNNMQELAAQDIQKKLE